MTIRVFNPTSESMVTVLEPAPRLQSLEGKTVGSSLMAKRARQDSSPRGQAASRALSSG